MKRCGQVHRGRSGGRFPRRAGRFDGRRAGWSVQHEGDNGNGTSVAVQSSEITQNGQFVSSEQAKLGIESALVQRYLGH